MERCCLRAKSVSPLDSRPRSTPMFDLKEKLIGAYRHNRQRWNRLTGNDYPFNRLDPLVLQEIIATNRKALGLIPVWAEKGMLEGSVFNYGITPKTATAIERPIDDSCTYADLLVYFGRRLQKPLHYFELGVSVGKTFWQVVQACGPGKFVGFDIEALNPAIARHLVADSAKEWPTMKGSMKKTPSSYTRYRHEGSGSEVGYLCGDIFDPNAWEALRGGQFNLILSDAFHSPEAVDKEWDHIVRLKLLDPQQCVMVWDDLDGPMHDWFLGKRADLREHFGGPAAIVTTVFVNGWLGRREYPHRVGLAVKGNVI